MNIEENIIYQQDFDWLKGPLELKLQGKLPDYKLIPKTLDRRTK